MAGRQAGGGKKGRSIGQQAARNNLKNGNPNGTQDKLSCQRGYKINEGQAPSLARGVFRRAG